MTNFPEVRNLLQVESSDHCVVMVHGLCANELELKRLANDLCEGGFSVVIPQIDGYSFGTPTKPWYAWVDQVLLQIQRLQKRFKSVSLIGLSMGAVISMVIAQRLRIPLASLILLSPSIAYDGWSIPWYNFFLKFPSWFPFISKYQMKESYPFGVKNEEMRRSIISSLKTNQISDAGALELSYESIKQGYFLIQEARKNIQLIYSPVLIIHSVDDEIVHVRNAEWLFRNISSSSKEIIYLGDSYHMITIDNEFDIVNRHTVDFLKKSVNAYFDEPVFETQFPISTRNRRKLAKVQAELFQLV